MPRIYKIFTLTLISFLGAGLAHASEQFDTSYNVLYNVSPTGETTVTQDISIVNRQNDVIATSYILTVKQMSIYDVTGTDGGGELEMVTTTKGDTTTIKTEFNQQVIGVDRSHEWQLKYKSTDIANQVGEVWHISIPKIDSLESTKDYVINLSIPKTFGPEIFISPNPSTKEEDDINYNYTFTKKSLEQEGITSSFGNYQILNFSLKYNLQNNSKIASQQEIALPPDIYKIQQVTYSSLEPLPTKIYEDKDGNLMAVYSLKGSENLNIGLKGSVRITGRQITPEYGGKVSKIPEKLIENYTDSEKFWETNSDSVKAIAERLFDEELTVSQNVQKVYNYVTENLNYDFEITEKEFVDRNGAKKALTTPGPWACMEFTDSFVAITRAMGIPSRELNGFAITREDNLTPLSISLRGGDLLHSWAEFYDPVYGWVQVDPTWGNTSQTNYFTKLDTNHFAFIIKGLNSEYPLPAGAYKVREQSKQAMPAGRQVEVEVSQNPDLNIFAENVKVFRAKKLNPIKSLQKKSSYSFYNESGIKLYNLNNSGKDLLPFSTQTIYLDKDANSFSYQDFNDESYTKTFNIEEGEAPRVYSNLSTLLVVFVALLLCGTIYAVAIHLGVLKKLLFRLVLRLRGRDQ